MTWKTISVEEERWQLIKAWARKEKSVREVCLIFGVSRKTAYKWKQRFIVGGRLGLRDRSRRPQRMPRQLAPQRIKRIRQLRHRHPAWGPKKLAAWLRPKRGPAVSARSIGRWLKRLGLSRPRLRHPRKAGWRRPGKLTAARRPNQVWTVDFKGWFRTGNGQRCEPLTVRDLFSRYGLLIKVLATQHGPPVKAAFTALFRRYGLPEVIRIDNGNPYASRGPAGLSQLSAWWLRLGIRVEFTRPGCPQDNGSHEQFHRVMKRETTRPAAFTRQGQQHRSTGWLHGYNHRRPHEALAQTVPARQYRKSRRKFAGRLPAVRYGRRYQVRQVRSNGEIRWRGRKRFIGEAFVHQPVALRRLKAGIYVVKFINLVIGHLHDQDEGAMRPMIYRHRHRPLKKTKV